MGQELHKLYGVDLFAGAGGLSLGGKQAGVTLLEAVESDPHACATYKLNFPNEESACNLHTDCISNYRPSRQLKLMRPLIVFGGPPCQGFSTSNQRTRSVGNPNNWLYKEFLRVVATLEPEYVVFENVKGIQETASGRFLREILSGLEQLDYNIACSVLRASDYGVPQTRERLFIMGSRVSQPSPPCPKHVKPPTVKDAIHDLPVLRNGAFNDTLPYRTAARSAYAISMRNDSSVCTGNLVTRNAPHIIERYRAPPELKPTAPLTSSKVQRMVQKSAHSLVQ